MAVSPTHAAEALANSARHCCICRRFRPLHLQVHHIKERSEGGTDEPANLIPICVTCHCDVHTETKLTRRFTHAELRQHRDNVYALVAGGKLAGREDDDDGSAIDRLAAGIVERLRTEPAVGMVAATVESVRSRLSPEAVDILLAAVTGDDPITVFNMHGAAMVIAGGRNFGEPGNHRQAAKLRTAVNQLYDAGLVEDFEGMNCVSEDGFAFADTLIASAADAPPGE